MELFDCIVVGAGIHGLCTAFWLRQNSVSRVAVVEQFEPGHSHGSSHGTSRITRSSYANPAFVAMAARAHQHEWPALERALERPLRTPTPGVFFGPNDGPIRDYFAATATTSAIERLDVGGARRRFPLLRFAPTDAILVDHTAAVVLAQETMQGLRQWLAAHAVELLWNTRVERIDERADRLLLSTSRGDFAAHQMVLAGGAWAGRLTAPPLPPPRVVRQQVGYFGLAAPAAALQAGAFPVWARIGHARNDFHYGMPATDHRGVKAAMHRTEGPSDDPESPPPAIDPAALLAIAHERFAVPVHDLRASEHCLYTMAAEDRLEVSRDSARTVRVTACSGHAFKFGPLIGRMAADLVDVVP